MDTIQVSIKLNKEKREGITGGDLMDIAAFINNITSPSGYRYCDYSQSSKVQNLIVKISYPRFYEGINAFLITNSTECMQVQIEFCLALMEHDLLRDAEIVLNRVDIPFTFHMDEDYEFNSYKKIYQVFDYVYKKKNPNASPNAITDVENFKAETIVYSDTANISAYNSKIMIYNQYKNIRSKTKGIKNLYEIREKYEDLPRRMRIEVSKRIRRAKFSLVEFSEFDIFSEYSEKFKEYILDNILDLKEIDNFYNEKIQELTEIFSKYRVNSKSNLRFTNYENIIYREIQNIHDCEVVRKALKIYIHNANTMEKVVTKVRKILRSYGIEENIIVMDTYGTIKDIREAIKQNFTH